MHEWDYVIDLNLDLRLSKTSLSYSFKNNPSKVKFCWKFLIHFHQMQEAGETSRNIIMLNSLKCHDWILLSQLLSKNFAAVFILQLQNIQCLRPTSRPYCGLLEPWAAFRANWFSGLHVSGIQVRHCWNRLDQSTY